MYVCVLNCFGRVQLFVTPWTVACQAPLSMGLSRQEYWSELPFPPPGDLPNPETEPTSPGPCIEGRFFIPEPPGKHYMSAISQFKIFSQRKRVV